MIERKLYYLMMVAGYLAVFIMLSIIIVGVMSIGGCSKTQPLLESSNPLCCISDEDYPLSCGGWKLCEFNSKGELI